MRPQIATTLPDGTYGQREMTEEEHAEWMETADIPQEQTEIEPTPEEETPTE